MQRRFTIIQGGLSDGSAERVLGPASGARVSGWRIVMRRPNEVDDAERTAWLALVANQPTPDPFAHPDYLLTAAQHGARGTDIRFVFAYAETARGPGALGAVLPLVMPHPVWGGSTIRLWHPPLAPRPVQPLMVAGSAPAILEAMIDRLRTERPRTSLRLGRIAMDGDLMRALMSSARLQVETQATEMIPAARIVAVAAREPDAEIERITAPERIRDAVERFLLLDAERSRRPLIGDPGDASILRMVTRHFAQSGETCVELGLRDGALVSGAIRLGKGDAQILWRAVSHAEPLPSVPATADVDIRPADEACQDDSAAWPRLVTN